MQPIKKIEDLILPHQVDFFKRLQDQSILTKKIIDELKNHYSGNTKPVSDVFASMIKEAEDLRRKNLDELYQVFITPVDTESISRAYINLDWVVMSVKHLEAELEIYGITDLHAYKTILDLLGEEMHDMNSGFAILSNKKAEKSTLPVFNIVHLDNEVIKEYARQVYTVVQNNDIKTIFTHKEILDQLREISKRIRMCAGDLEDMLFKMR